MKTRLRLPGEAWPSRPRTRARYLRVVVHTYWIDLEDLDLAAHGWQWYVRKPRSRVTVYASGTASNRAEAMRQALEWAVANAAVVEFGDRDIRRWARKASR